MRRVSVNTDFSFFRLEIAVLALFAAGLAGCLGDLPVGAELTAEQAERWPIPLEVEELRRRFDAEALAEGLSAGEDGSVWSHDRHLTLEGETLGRFEAPDEECFSTPLGRDRMWDCLSGERWLDDGEGPPRPLSRLHDYVESPDGRLLIRLDRDAYTLRAEVEDRRSGARRTIEVPGVTLCRPIGVVGGALLVRADPALVVEPTWPPPPLPPSARVIVLEEIRICGDRLSLLDLETGALEEVAMDPLEDEERLGDARLIEGTAVLELRHFDGRFPLTGLLIGDPREGLSRRAVPAGSFRVEMVDPERGFASGAAGTALTLDAGRSWLPYGGPDDPIPTCAGRLCREGERWIEFLPMEPR